jgi:predicted dehydrogenase
MTLRLIEGDFYMTATAQHENLLTWGILGSGGIARKLAGAINASAKGTLLAVGSRAQESADRFGEEFNVPRRYASYDELLADKDVQAVYISLPNHLHAEWAIRSADAGKQILCEKPLTVNAAEAEHLIEVIRARNVLFMEAFQYRCHPMMARICDLIREGAIGTVKIIQASFQYNLGPKYENIRLSNPAAGGGIMDVGCYTLALARLVAGAAVGQPFSEPLELKGCAAIGEISRVDEQATAALKFPGDIVAYLACGTQCHGDRAVRIFGSGGMIDVPMLWIPSEKDNKIILHRTGSESTEIIADGHAGAYTVEADLFTDAYHAGLKEAANPAMTWADSIGNMRALDRWRESVGLVFDVENRQ